MSGLNSAAASSRVLTEPDRDAFLYAISESIEKNEKLRNGEITKALIHRVVSTPTNDDYFVDPTKFAFFGVSIQDDDYPIPRSWEAPLLGILNLVEPEALKDDENFNPDIVKPILAAFSSIVDRIWQDLSYLLHEGTIGDYRRCLVARTIYMISQIPGQTALVLLWKLKSCAAAEGARKHIIVEKIVKKCELSVSNSTSYILVDVRVCSHWSDHKSQCGNGGLHDDHDSDDEMLPKK